MKIHKITSLRKGFTLLELMVAMAITTLIIGVLVSVTAVALDTWNGSRAGLKAGRQGKSFIDLIAKDFEAMIIRRGGPEEWLTAVVPQTLPGINILSTNACDLRLFTAVTDRYDGQIAGKDQVMGNADDPAGGDVSCVGYSLKYKEPIVSESRQFQTFVMSRHLVNPDLAFRDLLGKTDLRTAFMTYEGELDKPESFICENIFQFTVTFNVRVAQATTPGNPPTFQIVPITIGAGSGYGQTNSVRIYGTGMVAPVTNSPVSPEELAAGRLMSIDLSTTVLSDFAINQLRARKFTGQQESEFILKNSYQYSRKVQVSTL